MSALNSLDLGYNTTLQSNSISKLLQELWSHHVPIANLDLTGCSQAFTECEDLSNHFQRLLTGNKKLNSLILPKSINFATTLQKTLPFRQFVAESNCDRTSLTMES